MAVRVIPARQNQKTNEGSRIPAKLRVAAYCRVSTDLEEQESSYEAQVSHYNEMIRKNPDWELHHHRKTGKLQPDDPGLRGA